MKFIRKLVSCGAMGIALCVIPLTFNTYAQKTTETTVAAKNPLLGRWKSSEAVIEFRADGSILIDDEEYKYKVKGTVIAVSNTVSNGARLFPFELDGDTLTVEVQDREVVYTRLKGKSSPSASDAYCREE